MQNAVVSLRRHPVKPMGGETLDLALLDAEVGAFVCVDRVAAAPAAHGPMGGISVGVKDLFRVDGFPTGAGSRLPSRLFEGPESVVVGRLRAAGASIVGKTAMDEFAYCEPPPTKNPRDRRRTPGGSSGGSAAAVAAGMCPLAIGSQTLQSTIVPASYCGVVGYKPTYGRVAFDGVPLSPSFDTVGFLGATVEVVRSAARQVLPDWRSTTAPPKPVLGRPQRWGMRRHSDGWHAHDRHVNALSEAGFDVRRGLLPWNDDLTYWAATIRDLVHGEMAHTHRVWFRDHADLYRPRTRQGVERGQTVSSGRLAECLHERQTFKDLVHQATLDAGVDCWVCPATGTVAPVGYHNTGDSWMTSFWSYAGWPAITLPIFDGPDGMPRGLQCIAPAGRDEELLEWATTLSSALTGARA
jgi:Asp-tRNA(Asn)/Glu-tRNA(Gln) amidotransferase A subunit family amidase